MEILQQLFQSQLVQSQLLSYLLHFLAGLLAIFLGLRLARFGRNWVHDTLDRTSITPSLVNLFTTVTYYFLVTAAILLSLAFIGVPTTTLLTTVGIIIVVIGIALQESLSNLAATITFLLFQPFKVGDLIEAGGVTGTVREIQLFSTVITTFGNHEVTIPNGKIQSNNITNYSQPEILRPDLRVSISYKDDMRRARHILEEMVNNHPLVLADPSPRVVVTELGDNGVELAVRPYVKAEHYWEIQFDLIEQIKLSFDEAGLSFPFPQQDVHLDLVQSPIPPPS